MTTWQERAKQRMEAITSVAPHEVFEAPITSLIVSPLQVRHEFNPQRLEELAESIRRVGVIQPLLVRRRGHQFEVVSGERRWRASQLAGLKAVPVYEREMSDEDALRAAAYENLNRDDLTAFEAIKIRAQVAQQVLGTANLQETRELLNRLDKTSERGEEWTRLEREFAALGRTSLSTFTRNQIAVFGWHPDVVAALESGMQFTLARTVQHAPEELRNVLLSMAQEGRSRSELLAHIKSHSPKQLAQEKRVARNLGSQKWLDAQTPTEAEATAAWLALAPPHVTS